VCPDWMGSWGEDPPDDEAPAPQSPYGPRPAGMRPAGMRPAGMRPAGMRPAGMRPAGMRPAGMRPAGMRPAGMRPAGMRPAGMRPAGMREDDLLDPEEWSADIAELFCAESAVVRLGARLVVGTGSVPVTSLSPVEDGADYLEKAPPPNVAIMEPEAVPTPEQPEVELILRQLRPHEHELAVRVNLPDYLVSTLAQRPDAAWAIKQDMARALAFRADQAFLHGANAPPDNPTVPIGISGTAGVNSDAISGDLLQKVRKMVTTLRKNDGARFGAAGWVLHPTTLETLASETDGHRSLESTRLLKYDGSDGGILFGYPFVVSRATDHSTDRRRIYFSCDWDEAWIAAENRLVTVDIASDASSKTGATVVSAVMYHDFAVRTPAAFICPAA
jgi:HK97 family phage major capsid protein